jgi:uncharacterized protein YndB with AHSA1/START domain
MAKNIHHRFFFPHSPQVVWDYLTNPGLIEQWLMKTDFMPLLGYQFHFFSKPVPQIDFDGTVYATVVNIKPYTNLAYSWKFGPGDGSIKLDSLVEWTLHPKNGGTELELLHSGFSELEAEFNLYQAHSDGWYKNIQKILQSINAATHGTTNT